MYGYVLLGLALGLISIDLADGRPTPDVLPVALGMAALVAGILAVGLALSARILWRRGALERDEQRFLRSVGRLGKLYRLLVVGAYAVMLLVLDWPALVLGWVGGRWALPASALVVAPFVVLLAVSWSALYWADRTLRAVLFERAGVGAVAGRWTLPRYLVFALRQHLLIVLVPLLALVALEDVVAYVLGPAGQGPLAAVILLGAVGGALVLSGPWIRTCWRTEPLPEGDLRTRLTAVARRAGIRIGNILVWRTNLTMVNGCMIGAVGPLRYILITDALLLGLPSDEVEAVFAHEAGHVKHHHAAFYAILALGGMSGAVALGGLLHWITGDFWTGTVGTAGSVLAYWWLVFGYLSRRCELEADLYAVSTVACPAGCAAARDAAARDAADAGPRADPLPVCAHTVALFTSALRRIARLNGAAETAGGWRHFSVARRCAFLEALACDPAGVGRFRRRLRSLKRAALVAVAAAAVAAALVGLPDFLESHNPEDTTRPEDIPPPEPGTFICLVDRDEVHRVPFGPPEFDGHADVAADLDDRGAAGLGRRAAPTDDDVAVADSRCHAVAIDPQREGPRGCGAEAGQVDEFGDAVGRRLG